jgi:hypothetical protein
MDLDKSLSRRQRWLCPEIAGDAGYRRGRVFYSPNHTHKMLPGITEVGGTKGWKWRAATRKKFLVEEEFYEPELLEPASHAS